jgi:hypothetical protein
MYVNHNSESTEWTKSKNFDWMTKEIIEFELNNGWKKCLRVCFVENHVLHKDKQCIPSSKVERLGSRMIGESLNQGKAYPMNSCGRTNRNF